MTLALYRAYRPGALSEVVGQDHVTAPLSRALTTGRVHHAYLFSGPRGCGKTSTARILARSLNCEQGPTPQPCGVCDNCVALAPNGPGSEDVVELDAASHGGVDDTRELRDRVVYSPARSRYRIYIIDEAHMVTTQGFNALLKVIEEPPDYVRFIFATTEPEKVLSTIRSRTFNYSFRLVSVGVLSGHLASVCRSEQVPFEEAALPLIAKAAGGSVRDALSILGQLISGSGPDGLTYGFVAEGLGLTDTVLLDRVVRALAARDGAEAFVAVDAVVESGHDGRRFLSDLLQRLRDLIVLQHVPAQEQASLLQLPADQIEALRAQAELFGPAELSRAADLVSDGLSELKGATSPRLQLELLLARLLLPASDSADLGIAARLDRLERASAVRDAHAAAGPPTAAAASAGTTAATTAAGPGAARPPEAGPRAGGASPSGSGGAQQPQAGDSRPSRAAGRPSPPPKLSDLAPATASGAGRRPAQTPPPTDQRGGPGPEASRGAEREDGRATGAPGPGGREPQPEGAAPSSAPGRREPAGAGPARAPGVDLGLVRNGWSAVLAELGKRSRVAWALWDSSQPMALSNGELTVAVADRGRLSSIKASRREELLRQVLIDVLRLDVKVVPVLAEPGAAADGDAGDASPDDPDLGGSEQSGVDLVIREFGAVPIGEIGES